MLSTITIIMGSWTVFMFNFLLIKELCMPKAERTRIKILGLTVWLPRLIISTEVCVIFTFWLAKFIIWILVGEQPM